MTITSPRRGRAFLSNAAKLHEVFDDLFRVDHKNLPYDHYRRIAVSSLEPHQKNELRAWSSHHSKKINLPHCCVVEICAFIFAACQSKPRPTKS